MNPDELTLETTAEERAAFLADMARDGVAFPGSFRELAGRTCRDIDILAQRILEQQAEIGKLCDSSHWWLKEVQKDEATIAEQQQTIETLRAALTLAQQRLHECLTGEPSGMAINQTLYEVGQALTQTVKAPKEDER